MREIISIFKPFIIYHAAAYKHVPIVEHNLIEGLKNNLIGTFELANCTRKNVSNLFLFQLIKLLDQQILWVQAKDLLN